MKPVVCFGEIMARLAPPGFLRLRQAMPGALEVTFAGAEANAAAMIAALGGRAEFVSALPRHEITEACLANLRAANIGTGGVVLRDEGRFGLYFVEAGVNQRAGNVLYDREGSTFSVSPADTYDWPRRLAGAGWLHTTGISAGVSRVGAEATLAAVRAAQSAGLTVSCDLNYRRKLWRWDGGDPADLARRTLGAILPHIDVVIGNAADLALAAGLTPPAAGAGQAALPQLHALAAEAARRFPNLRWVALTLREGCSATFHRWGALLLRVADGTRFLAPSHNGEYIPFEIPQIVDRLGAGDAFAGALIFAFLTPELAAPETALRFAVAASCLAHSIKGDFNYCTRGEIEALMEGGNGGGVSR